MSRAVQQNFRQFAFKTTQRRPAVNVDPPRPPHKSFPTSKSVNSSRRKPVKPRKHQQKLQQLRTVRDFEHSYRHQIPKASFQKLVRSLMQKVSPIQYRITASALEALQEVSEEHLTNYFEQLNILANHAKRVTVMPVDAASLRRLDSFRR